MKWSIFTYHVKGKNGVVVYNTLNNGVVYLENEKYDNLFNSQNNKKIIKELRKREFILEDNINEKEKFMEVLLNDWNNANFLGLHILTTTGCNFKCPYCYQCGIKADVLTEEKMHKELSFLDEYIKKHHIKECRVEITGGEPTTNWKIVEKLLPNLKRIFKKNHVKYETLIVTNGYLFTKEKVDLISKYHWKRLQITLDGLNDITNKRRLLKNNGKSFDTIINNLDYIIFKNKIKKVNLRINYDNSNIDEIPKFLDFIKERYGTRKIQISLGLITRTVDDESANDFIIKNGIKEDEFAGKYLKLYKEAIKRGFKMSDIFAFDGMCTAKLKHGFLLEPNGNITKCVSGVGRKEFKIGNYLKNEFSTENYLYPNLYEECLKKECPFLPICHTGCRFESFINNKDKTKNICKRDLLEKLNNEIIRINYLGDD